MVKFLMELTGKPEKMMEELLNGGHYKTRREILREGVRLVYEKTKQMNGK